MAPSGIVVKGDTTVIGTADGLQITTNNGAEVDRHRRCNRSAGQGPRRYVFRILVSEYVRRVAANTRGWTVATLRGNQRLRHTPTGWRERADRCGGVPAGQRATHRAAADTRARPAGFVRWPTRCRVSGSRARTPLPPAPLTVWFRRPIAPTDNSYIDQTYRYGSTMGGNFQQHQGVEFNNPDGTPVYAIGRARWCMPAGPSRGRSPSPSGTTPR